MFFFVYFFGGLECVGHSFAYVAHLWFLRDVWIRTQSAGVASWRATDLATHPSIHNVKLLQNMVSNRTQHPTPSQPHICIYYTYWFRWFSNFVGSQSDQIQNVFFVYFFGGLECVGHSFAYVAHFWFLRDVWIRTLSAAVASWRATDLARATHPSIQNVKLL